MDPLGLLALGRRSLSCRPAHIPLTSGEGGLKAMPNAQNSSFHVEVSYGTGGWERKRNGVKMQALVAALRVGGVIGFSTFFPKPLSVWPPVSPSSSALYLHDTEPLLTFLTGQLLYSFSNSRRKTCFSEKPFLIYCPPLFFCDFVFWYEVVAKLLYEVSLWSR